VNSPEAPKKSQGASVEAFKDGESPGTIFRTLDNTAAWILIAPSQIAEARLNRHLSNVTE
jgi:hypothetical protein